MSQAVRRWRKGWLDRQHDEAAPAVGISRGQASVPEPLMVMQQSIARMRAIIMSQTKNTPRQGSSLGFWITIVLMICLIGGLFTYILSTYTGSSQLTAQISTATGAVQPTLSLQGTKSTTVHAGQTLHVHGQDFTPGDSITFILDTTAINGPNGKPLSIQSTTQGTFDAAVPIPANWLAGSYALQAQDNHAGQHAFLDLQILPATDTAVNNTPLVFTAQGRPLLAGLTFAALRGSNTPQVRRITFTNLSLAPLNWAAEATADNNLSWLSINEGKTSGRLNPGETDILDISVLPTNLSASYQAYTGQLIFTVGQQQAIIPISLRVEDVADEVVLNPDPIIAYLQPGGAGTCQPATLTLINLGQKTVTWTATLGAGDDAYIHIDGAQGTLQSGGLSGDSRVLNITCSGAQIGEKLYHISVSYNSNAGVVTQDVPISIRNA